MLIFVQCIGESLRWEHFEEAAHDMFSGLTTSALRGIHKQSVEDVERLFSDAMVTWMEKKGYAYEANYIRSVCDRRKACNQRELSVSQQSQCNQDFLDYILDEMMHWHRDNGHQSPQS